MEKIKRLLQDFDKVWVIGIHQDYIKRLIDGKDSMIEITTNLRLLNDNIWCDYMEEFKISEIKDLGKLREDNFFELICCYDNNQLFITDLFSPTKWDFSISDNKLSKWIKKLCDLTNGKKSFNMEQESRKTYHRFKDLKKSLLS